MSVLVLGGGTGGIKSVNSIKSVKAEEESKIKKPAKKGKKKTKLNIERNKLAVNSNIIHPKHLPKVSKYENFLNKKKEKAKCIKFGTMTILKSNDFSMESNKFHSTNKKEMDYKDKLKMKWKTIQYLIANKKSQIELLTRNLKKFMEEILDESNKSQNKIQNKSQNRKSILLPEQHHDLVN